MFVGKITGAIIYHSFLACNLLQIAPSSSVNDGEYGKCNNNNNGSKRKTHFAPTISWKSSHFSPRYVGKIIDLFLLRQTCLVQYINSIITAILRILVMAWLFLMTDDNLFYGIS